jgi:signal transduction histidine kinase
VSRIEDDIALIASIDAVPSILEVACRVTGLRFAAIARVTDTHWVACAVRDEIKFGLEPGGELDISTTICSEIRDSGAGVVIDHVDQDESFCGHPTPAMYGFQSYISMPIVRRNGEFFGTLCALDPKPAKLDPGTVATFQLFTELIAMHLDNRERLVESEAALRDAADTAALREQFIAVLGHDLRNPLASIEAGTRVLETADLDARSAKVVALMQQSCRRMGALINDVLDLARGQLGGGLTVAQSDAAELGDLLDQVVGELRAVYPGRRIDAAIALPPAMLCDPPRIAQLLSNLLANALTHGAADAPVEVRGHHTGGVFTLAVANHGQPIPADKMQKLFQPFTRGGDGSPQAGLGLGLYIAAEIAKAHGGTLSVHSTPAETSFTLTMPCESAIASERRVSEDSAADA